MVAAALQRIALAPCGLPMGTAFDCTVPGGTAQSATRFTDGWFLDRSHAFQPSALRHCALDDDHEQCGRWRQALGHARASGTTGRCAASQRIAGHRVTARRYTTADLCLPANADTLSTGSGLGVLPPGDQACRTQAAPSRPEPDRQSDRAAQSRCLEGPAPAALPGLPELADAISDCPDRYRPFQDHQ
ncbi:hypothetical protein D3C81_1463780 [compost metagenome]